MINWPGKPEFSLDASRHIGIVDAPVRDVRQLSVAVPFPPIVIERRRLSLWPMLVVMAMTLAIFAPDAPIRETVTKHPPPQASMISVSKYPRVMTQDEIDDVLRSMNHEIMKSPTRMRYVSGNFGARYVVDGRE